MANLVEAMCTAAMASAARWLNVGALFALIFSRCTILSMRRVGTRWLVSVGALPAMRQQLLDPAVQLRRQSGEHVFQVGPRLMPVELGRLQQAHHHRCPLPRQLAPNEEPIAPTQGPWPNPVALESAPPSGRVSVEHVVNVLGRLKAVAAPEGVQTTLQVSTPAAGRYGALRPPARRQHSGGWP